MEIIIFLALALVQLDQSWYQRVQEYRVNTPLQKEKKNKCIDVYKENSRVPFSFSHPQPHNPTLNVAIITSNVKNLVNILTRFFLGI